MGIKLKKEGRLASARIWGIRRVAVEGNGIPSLAFAFGAGLRLGMKTAIGDSSQMPLLTKARRVNQRNRDGTTYRSAPCM
jgi:hypothetical protein